VAILSAQPITVGAPVLFPRHAAWSRLPLRPLDLPAQGLKPQPETTWKRTPGFEDSGIPENSPQRHKDTKGNSDYSLLTTHYSPSSEWRLLGRFRVTFYWLVEEDQYPGERTVPLFTRREELLGYFPYRFVRDFRMESCARLSDGRLISDPGSGNRCRVVDAPLGSRDYTLTALKSVAVDPSVVPMGAQLYIPAAAGIKLGLDSVHDGRFLAQDVGAFIQGRHIDIYVGPKSNLDLFPSSSLCRSGRVDVYLVPRP
jgi:3D (Asp-Asp-Asp) domain-containing protein